jgi:hypothetical protein
MLVKRIHELRTHFLELETGEPDKEIGSSFHEIY